MTAPVTLQDKPLSPSWWERLAPRPPRPPAPSASRAGRNLPAAIITALILLAVVAASLFIRIEAFHFVILGFMFLALWEAAGAFLQRGFRIPIIPLWLSAIAIVVTTWIAGPTGLLISFILCMALVTAWRVIMGRPWAARDSAAACFALAWIGLLGGFAVLLTQLPFGPWAVVAFLLLPIFNDTGGYLVGILLGKHPIAPSISPKKSWEGFAGSVFFTTAIGIVLAVFALDIPWWWGVVLGVSCAIASTCGDLAESLLKRDLGVKDMGTIFPGHGGALDRVDSILVCAPVVYSILHFAI